MFSRYEYKKASFSLKGNKEGCKLNFEGAIIDKNLRTIPTFLDEEGYPCVEIEGYLGHKVYRIVDLMVVQFKNLYLPEELLHEVVGFNINNDLRDLRAVNIGYRFKSGSLENIKFPGYYYIPSFSENSISKDCKLIKSATGEVRTCYRTKYQEKNKATGGYNTFVARQVNGKHISGLRHRAMWLAFKPYPNNIDDLVINHLDGVPGNDTLDNLELTTKALNNKHARDNGLRMQQLGVIARNVHTGEETTYYSMSECERALGVHWDTLFRRLKDDKRFGEVLQCGYQVKYATNETAFPEVKDPDKVIADAKQSIDIEVLNCLTKEITKYPSINAAAKALNLKASAISWKFSAGNTKPLKGYLFRLDEKDEFPVYNETDVKESLRETNLRISAHNLLDDSEMLFESLSKACKWYGISFVETLSKGRQPIYPDGWRFKFENDTWDVIVDVDETLYRLEKSVQVLKLSTNEISLFTSAAHAEKYCNIAARRIREAAFSRGSKEIDGYVFRLGKDLTKPWTNND